MEPTKKIKWRPILNMQCFCKTIVTLTAMFICQFSFGASSKHIVLKITCKNVQSIGSVRVIVSNVLIDEFPGSSYSPNKSNGNTCWFDIPVNARCGYFNVTLKGQNTDSSDVFLTTPQFWENGDNIDINIQYRKTKSGAYSKTSFSGVGSLKYILCNKLSEIRMVELVDRKPFDGNILKNKLPALSPTLKLRLKFLAENKHEISRLSYQVIKAQLLSTYYKSNLKVIQQYYDSIKGERVLATKFASKFKRLFALPDPYDLSDDGMANSKDYISYLNEWIAAKNIIETGYSSPTTTYGSIVNSRFEPKTKESMLLLLFVKTGSDEALSTVYKNSEQYVRSDNGKQILNELGSRWRARINDLPFTDKNGRAFAISDFKGKIILIDFWFYGCGACAQFYKEVISKIEKLDSYGKKLIVVSISIDNTNNLWLKGMASNLYTSDQAINVNAGLVNHESAILDILKVDRTPTVLLLDQSGTIQAFDTKELYDLISLKEKINNLIDKEKG